MNNAKKLPQVDPDSESHISALHPIAKAVVFSPDEDRITFIGKKRWIPYPRAKEALEDLQSIFEGDPVVRPPCRLILGATNNGKTEIMLRFVKTHPRIERTDGEGMLIPALYVISPGKPDEKRLYESFLRGLGVPVNKTDTVGRRQDQFLRVAQEVGLRILMIDEIHSILGGGHAQRTEFLTILKLLSGELQIPIVCAGTKTAFHAMNLNPEVGNRFEPIALPRWEFDEEFLSLLASFEMLIPLRLPSNLPEESLAARIFDKTEGRIGEVAKLLREAAKVAIRSKVERIDARTLDAARFDPPQQRTELPNGID
jgi:hypothetical protein